LLAERQPEGGRPFERPGRVFRTPWAEQLSQEMMARAPGKPMLMLEIRTDDCRKLERALHAVLDLRERKIGGGGAEWFAITRDEVVALQANL
jgi:hypothetical protein